jgi:hypothetical protein
MLVNTVKGKCRRRGKYGLMVLCLSILPFVFGIAKPDFVLAQDAHSSVEVELRHDDGTARDYLAVCGGYLVDFLAPAKGFKIKNVRIFGQLVGTYDSGSTYQVEIWNNKKELQHYVVRPITDFSHLAPKWVEIDIPNIKVVDKFYIHVYIGTCRAQGIHMGADDSITNQHSQITTSSGELTTIRDSWPFPPERWFANKSKVNWMIRVVVTPGSAPQPTESRPETATDLSSVPKPEPTTSESAPTTTEDKEPAATGDESESLANKLTNLPSYTIVALYSALGITAVIVAFFFIFRLQRKRQAEAFAKTKKAYEKKLAQWEKEGYDVDEYKKKWFKEH